MSAITNNNLVGQGQYNYDCLMEAVGKKDAGGVVTLKDFGEVENLAEGGDKGVIPPAEQNRATKEAVYKAILARFGGEGSDDKYANPYIQTAFEFLLCGDDAPLKADEMKCLDQLLNKGSDGKDGVEEDDVAKDTKALRALKWKSLDDGIQSAAKKLPPGDLTGKSVNALMEDLGKGFAEGIKPFLKKGPDNGSFADDVTADDLREDAAAYVADALLGSELGLKETLLGKGNLQVLVDAHDSNAKALQKALSAQDNAKARVLEFKAKVLGLIIGAAPKDDKPKPRVFNLVLDKKTKQCKAVEQVKVDKPKSEVVKLQVNVAQPKVNVVQQVNVAQPKSEVCVNDLSDFVSDKPMKQYKYSNCCWFLSAVNAIKSMKGGLDHLRGLIKDGHVVTFYDTDKKAHTYDFNESNFGLTDEDLDQVVEVEKKETTVREFFTDYRAAGCSDLELCVMYHAMKFGQNRDYKLAATNDMDSACKMLGLIPVNSSDALNLSESQDKDVADQIKRRLKKNQVVTFRKETAHFVSIVDIDENNNVKIRDSNGEDNEVWMSMKDICELRRKQQSESLYFMLLPGDLDKAWDEVQKQVKTSGYLQKSVFMVGLDELQKSFKTKKVEYEGRLAPLENKLQTLTKKDNEYGSVKKNYDSVKKDLDEVSLKIVLADNLLEELKEEKDVNGSKFEELREKYVNFLATEGGKANVAGMLALNPTYDDDVFSYTVMQDFTTFVLTEAYQTSLEKKNAQEQLQ